MIQLDFEHWHYEFTEDDLSYCSKNKSITERKAALRSRFSNAKLKYEHPYPIILSSDQILCANEVFPEAAISDPIADLQIWDEWRSGTRVFPYPGKYARLSITQQLGKTSSNSSTGVLGEIIAGLLGQTLIGANILVRVVNAWPDFIFFPVHGRYSFLEAKAFTQQDRRFLDLDFGVPKNTLSDCLQDSAQELLVDPSLKIFYAITEVKKIRPTLELHTRLFEFEAPSARRKNAPTKVPDVVISELAKRAIQQGIFVLINERRDYNDFEIDAFIDKRNSKIRERAENILIVAAIENIESVLGNIERIETLKQIDQKKIEEKIREQVRNFKIHEFETDREYLYSQQVQRETISEVRQVAIQSIYKVEIPYEAREKIIERWNKDKENSSLSYQELNNLSDPYKKIGICNLWRCGNFLFFLHDDRREDFDLVKREVESLWE